jgi:hypothetical protein
MSKSWAADQALLNYYTCAMRWPRGVCFRDYRVIKAHVHYAFTSIIPASKTYTHFKPPMCCEFVQVASAFSCISGALFIAE